MIIGTLAMLLIGAASLPAIFILVYVYRKDRTEREPGGLLLKLVLMGFLSAVFAVGSELLGGMIFERIPFASEIQANFWKYLIVVALSEEFFKYILMKKATWKNINFNCTYDGVVYAVFTSLGFAILENFLYIIDGGIKTALIRAVTAIPGHASFGIFMGVFYGIAKKYQGRDNEGASLFFRILAVFMPTLLHGIYDFSTTLGSLWLFLGFIIAMFLFAFKMIHVTSDKDTIIGEIPGANISEETIVNESEADTPVSHVIITPKTADGAQRLTNYRTGGSDK